MRWGQAYRINFRQPTFQPFDTCFPEKIEFCTPDPLLKTTRSNKNEDTVSMRLRRG